MKKTLISAFVFGAFSMGVAAFSPAAVAAPAAAGKASANVVVKSTGTKDNASPVDETTRLAVFDYNDNLVYNILCQDGINTHIDLPPGETVQGFYISGDPRWKHLVAQDKSRIFIKPTLPGIFNSGTLVTNARVYELTFNSVKVGEPWYQRVRWEINQMADAEKSSSVSYDGMSNQGRSARSGRGGAGRSPRADYTNDLSSGVDFGTGGFDLSSDRGSSGGPKVSPDKLNFGYEIAGSASFKPVSAFDDGKATWVQLGDNPTMPALFMVNEKGGMEIVNYTVHGNYLKVSQIVPGLLLRLGDEEVRIVRKKACTGFWCK